MCGAAGRPFGVATLPDAEIANVSASFQRMVVGRSAIARSTRRWPDARSRRHRRRGVGQQPPADGVRRAGARVRHAGVRAALSLSTDNAAMIAAAGLRAPDAANSRPACSTRRRRSCWLDARWPANIRDAPVAGVGGVVIRGGDVCWCAGHIRRSRASGRCRAAGSNWGSRSSTPSAARYGRRRAWRSRSDDGGVVDHIDRDDAGRVRYHFVIVDYLCRPSAARCGRDDVEDVCLADRRPGTRSHRQSHAGFGGPSTRALRCTGRQ